MTRLLLVRRRLVQVPPRSCTAHGVMDALSAFVVFATSASTATTSTFATRASARSTLTVNTNSTRSSRQARSLCATFRGPRLGRRLRPKCQLCAFVARATLGWPDLLPLCTPRQRRYQRISHLATGAVAGLRNPRVTLPRVICARRISSV